MHHISRAEGGRRHDIPTAVEGADRSLRVSRFGSRTRTWVHPGAQNDTETTDIDSIVEYVIPFMIRVMTVYPVITYVRFMSMCSNK